MNSLIKDGTISTDKTRALRGLLYHSKHNGVYNSRGVIRPAFQWTNFKKQYKICTWCGFGIDDNKRYWHNMCYQYYSAALGNTVYANTDRALIDWPDFGEPGCNICNKIRTDSRFELDHKIAISIARFHGRKPHLKSLIPDNLQWLCVECHKSKTKQDRKQLADLLNPKRLKETLVVSNQQINLF